MIIVSQDQYTVMKSNGISLVFPKPLPHASIIDTDSGKLLGNYPPDRARVIMQAMTNMFMREAVASMTPLYLMPRK